VVLGAGESGGVWKGWRVGGILGCWFRRGMGTARRRRLASLRVGCRVWLFDLESCRESWRLFGFWAWAGGGGVVLRRRRLGKAGGGAEEGYVNARVVE